MRIVEEGMDSLEDYCAVPIAFEVRSRLSLDHLRSGEFVELQAPERVKDYDAVVGERPTELPSRFDTSRWSLLAALVGDERVGGAVLARDTTGMDMLEGRADLALIVDIRVAPERRGAGVGRALFEASCQWATQNGCTELIVETQDTNVAACRFYAAMGCRLKSVEETGYPGYSDEAKLVWSREV